MAKKPIPVKLFNSFDEWATLVGLGHYSADGKSLEYSRYPGETNKQLRTRIKEAMEHQGNATVQGLINNISRDLGISTSGNGLLPWYNSETKSIFHLSEPPYPGPTGIVVFVSNSGSFSNVNQVGPQVRASGYATATSGWIVWNTPDLDPESIQDYLPGSSGWYAQEGISELYSSGVTYGNYTQILEFIGETIPSTDNKVRVDYLVQTETDDLGRPVLNWRSDFSNTDDPNDKRFIGLKSVVPTGVIPYSGFITSGAIAIYSANDLISSPVSGHFYDDTGHATAKLKRLKKIVDDQYPLKWGRFRFDIGRWDQLETSSVGEIPSFHDQGLDMQATMYDGSKYGVDLDVVGVQITASGARSAWYPKFQPGEFYMASGRYYMFGKMTFEYVTFTQLWNGPLFSGQIVASGDDMPKEFNMITAQTSGRFYNDTALPHNTYIKRIHDYAAPVSGIYYRQSYVDTADNIINPSSIALTEGENFYYDYNTGDIFVKSGSLTNGDLASGVFICWEHRDVDASGIQIVYSGGFGFSELSLNPLTDVHNKIFKISE